MFCALQPIFPYIFLCLPEYIQNICTEGNGEIIPIQKLTMSVTEVIVMDTAASDNISPIRSGTLFFILVRRHAANITKVSSIPIPVKTEYVLSLKLRMLFTTLEMSTIGLPYYGLLSFDFWLYIHYIFQPFWILIKAQ